MNIKKSLLGATALVIALGGSLMATTAQARDYAPGYSSNGNHYGNGYNQGNNGNRYGQKRYRHAQKQARKAYKARVYDWNTERGMYNSNWNRISDTNRRALDQQMRSQWMSYHNNNYSGATTWNNYNDPKFIDYLHTSNPSLLSNLRTQLGF